MPVEVKGFYEGHDVVVDASSNWPTVSLTCTCGWTSEVNGEEEHGVKDAISRVWIHTGGPANTGKEVGLLDENTLSQLIDLNINPERNE